MSQPDVKELSDGSDDDVIFVPNEADDSDQANQSCGEKSNPSEITQSQGEPGMNTEQVQSLDTASSNPQCSRKRELSSPSSEGQGTEEDEQIHKVKDTIKKKKVDYNLDIDCLELQMNILEDKKSNNK